MECPGTRQSDANEHGLELSLAFPEAVPAALKYARVFARTSASATINVFDVHGEWLTVEESSVFSPLNAPFALFE
jgi:hypothetical protein